MWKHCSLLSVLLMMSVITPQPAVAGEVVLYSSNNVETVNRVIDLFNKENPDVRVSVVRAGTGALMQRIKAESANPLGDIFWSGGLATMAEFKPQFESYSSRQASTVPAAYRGPDGLWLGTNVHINVLMVNTRQLGGVKAPQSWAELADPKWKGRLVIPDPERTSASYVALYGLQKTLGTELMTRIVRNATIVGTTSAAYDGVAKGEFAIALTMEYAAYEYVAGGLKEIKLVYPSEGTFVSVEGMALIKGGKHPAEARKLYEFLASKNVQVDIFKSAYRRPLRSDIDVSKLSTLPAIKSVKVVPLDDGQMAQDRAAFIAQWRQIIADR
ncbi:ABC transporter substrate-binding protein (plasmid) [Pantoea cypripedii]|uniref:ABC transporter substrate-binding protein n=2 Tax=Pantoea cypripedii TaxID=55209 RepID=A0A6B9G5D9_PANCY|nr:ABC transporter substrate-binding protein [Pantoea cypripedii]